MIMSTLLIAATFLVGCTSLKTPVVEGSAMLKGYKYVYVVPTQEKVSGSGTAVGIKGSLGASSTTSSLNPSQLIAGNLAKKGFILLQEISEEKKKETLIVQYGESGMRTNAIGWHKIEVTLQFLSAENNDLICTYSAEGKAKPVEADAIRDALQRALTEIKR